MGCNVRMCDRMECLICLEGLLQGDKDKLKLKTRSTQTIYRERRGNLKGGKTQSSRKGFEMGGE